MEGLLSPAAAWLADTGVRDWAGAAAYPWINTLHLLGLVMLIGAIGIVDLRVMGVWPALPASALERALTPPAIAGLVILLVSGTLLFAADGATLAGSTIFHAKLMIVAIGIANALSFRALLRRRVAGPPIIARIMAAASLAFWLVAGTLGRLIAYY